jgi:predicted HicB family RNase H-like nuclease
MTDTTIIQIRKVPASVHRALKHAATDQGKSLNRYVVDLLTQAMSNKAG